MLERDAAARRGVPDALLARVAIRAWWRPDGRFVSGAAYEAAVREQGAQVRELAKTEIVGRLPQAVTPKGSGQTSSVGDVGRTARDMPQQAPRRELPRIGVREDVREPEEVPAWDVFGRARVSGGALVFKGRER
jgi:hypothetical protein